MFQHTTLTSGSGSRCGFALTGWGAGGPGQTRSRVVRNSAYCSRDRDIGVARVRAGGGAIRPVHCPAARVVLPVRPRFASNDFVENAPGCHARIENAPYGLGPFPAGARPRPAARAAAVG